jgi:methionyl-tRNA formyltransferase
MTNIVYFGSPTFSAQILESLISNKEFNIVAVITNPDKPIGRSKIETPTPVAKIAEKNNIPIFKPEKLDDHNLTHIKLLKADLFLVISYGKIIPKTWIDTPRLKTLNVHFSLLPKYRGALCIQEAIKNQDQETGVTLMEMDELLDHGPIISQAKINIDINDNVATLTEKLTSLTQTLLKNKLLKYINGIISAKAQNHNKAILTPSHRSLNHQSAYIPYSKIKNPKTHSLINSLNPEPGAWTTLKNKQFKILQTKINEGKTEILKIQIPGKNPISWDSFQRGL